MMTTEQKRRYTLVTSKNIENNCMISCHIYEFFVPLHTGMLSALSKIE